MKNITKIFMLALLLFSLADRASAQYTFVVDALTKDSTALYPYSAPDADKWVNLADPVGSLKNGSEVIVAQNDTVVYYAKFKSLKKAMFSKEHKTYSGDVVAVTHNGARYYVDAKDLMLSPNDPTGKDFINREDNYHNFWGRFYSSLIPYIAIFLLLLAATVFAFLNNGSNGPRLVPTILVPVFMLLAIALEMFGVFKLGRDVLWWIDTDVIKKGRVIFRLVLFALAVIMQISSMKLYKQGIAGYVSDPDQKVLVKRPMVGALVGVSLLGVSVIVATIVPKHASLCLGIGAALLGIAVVVGIVSTAVVNCKALGNAGGIAFSLFVVIYGIGLLTTIIMLIIGFVNVFMEMLITVGGGVLAMVIMSKVVPTRSYTSGGVQYDVYEDFHIFGSGSSK